MESLILFLLFFHGSLAEDFGYDDDVAQFTGNSGDVTASADLGGFEAAGGDEFVRQSYEAEEEFM